MSKDETDTPHEKTPLTQLQVENFILLAVQKKERWFKLSFIDDEMNEDPTAAALMEIISDTFQDGITNLVLEERMKKAKAESSPIIIPNKGQLQ